MHSLFFIYNLFYSLALPSAAAEQHVPPAPPAAPPPHGSGPPAHVDRPGPGGAPRVRVRDHRRRPDLGQEAALDVQLAGRVRVTSGPDPAYHPSVAGSAAAASAAASSPPPRTVPRANTTLIVSFSIRAIMLASD